MIKALLREASGLNELSVARLFDLFKGKRHRLEIERHYARLIEQVHTRPDVRPAKAGSSLPQ